MRASVSSALSPWSTSRIRSTALCARLVTGVIEFMISWVRTRIRSDWAAISIAFSSPWIGCTATTRTRPPSRWTMAALTSMVCGTPSVTRGTSRGRFTADPVSAEAKASPYSAKSSTRTPRMADEQAARRLVGELDLAVVDGEQSGGGVVEHRLVEAVGVDQFVALVAELLDARVEDRREVAEARALAAVGEALAEIAEADRVDEAGDLHVGALDVVPEQEGGAEHDEAGDDPRRAEVRPAERGDEQEDHPDEQEQPPGEAEHEAVVEVELHLAPLPLDGGGSGWG